ncbi:CopM family metallochaperone [Microvirga guangxiensis]|uniref:DUF305 domain-containing protein n=1 Tax=Microvirga guangxiensis TaxID=549386 RepID=A0A1G5IPL7_9HYPH|nr:DUF305 domain-containing protein [Microvirga guangxiensis]SCY77691.1 protein of unknown function [Microvirga guangxiensis]
MFLRTLIVMAGVAALPALAFAQGGHHSGHSMPMQTQKSTDSAATKAYREANAKMHRDMDIPYTGDSDVDFVRGMIPHHQGAIDMAKVALQNTKDEQIRQWATAVIREQEREIAEMQAWLKKKGVQ